MKTLIENFLTWLTDNVGTIQATSTTKDNGSFMVKNLKDSADVDEVNKYLKDNNITHLYAKADTYKFQGSKEEVIYINKGTKVNADMLMPE